MERDKVTVERDADGSILMMYPSGAVEGARDARQARRKYDRWAREQAGDGVHVGLLEWRGFKAEEIPG